MATKYKNPYAKKKKSASVSEKIFGIQPAKKKAQPMTALGKYIQKEKKKGKHANGMYF